MIPYLNPYTKDDFTFFVGGLNFQSQPVTEFNGLFFFDVSVLTHNVYQNCCI